MCTIWSLFSSGPDVVSQCDYAFRTAFFHMEAVFDCYNFFLFSISLVSVEGEAVPSYLSLLLSSFVIFA